MSPVGLDLGQAGGDRRSRRGLTAAGQLQHDTLFPGAVRPSGRAQRGG